VWGDEDGDDISTDSDDDDSGQLLNFVVVKSNDEEENVIARPGFSVHFFYRTLFLIIDNNYSLVGRWSPRFLSINNLRPGSLSTTRAYLRRCYTERLCKVS
jgi:hypothetical protein